MGRQYTAELLRAQAQGATIVCSWQPFEGRKMEYAPRKKGDPQPWLVTGTWDAEWRYSGRDCHAMKDGEVYTPTKPVRPLTDDQRYVLRALHNNNAGVWYPACGWNWANRSMTVKHLEALVKKGYVEAVSREQYKERYEITDAGREEHKRQFPSIADTLREKTAELVEWLKENESGAVLVDDLTMWTWHDFNVTVQDAREDGSVSFSVAVKGIPMPLTLARVESREEALRRAAQSVIARTMRRAQIA